MDKICANCALYVKDQKGCIRNQRHEEETFSCADWTDHLDNCEICKRPTLTKDLCVGIYQKGAHYVCRDCAHKYGTCALCVNADCEFETNSDPMPKIVQKRIQQGNMIQIAQVRNEERVKKFCHSCSCWNKEGYCNREFNCCGNYKGVFD